MKLSVLLLTTLLTFTAMASDYQSEIDDFFNLYKTGKISEAVDSIYESNKYVSSIPDQVLNIKNQLTSLKGLVGEINNINKIIYIINIK